MRLFTMAAASAAALGLAACGGSSSSSDDLPTRFASLEDLLTAEGNGELEVADPAEMTATAQLSGGIEFRTDDGEGDLAVLGDLTLLADFDHGTVTGSATNNELYGVDEDEEYNLYAPLAGTLAVDGTITGSELTADVTGTLNDGEDIQVDASMDGTFYDYEGNLSAIGDVQGTFVGEDLYEEVGGGFAVIED